MDMSKNETCEKNLIEIFKVISWLDDKRWDQVERPDVFPDVFVEKVIKAKELQAKQKILIHWLIYITDRGKGADVLWEKNTPKIKELVVRYFGDGLSEKAEVKELCEKHEKENKIGAFPADLESIKRTLVLLLNYDKNIITFITRRLSEWKKENSDKFCARIAFSLYLLSYKGVGSLAKSEERRRQNQDELNEKTEEANGILQDDCQFDKQFERWYGQRWHKRIWAAVRDYKKFRPLSDIFIAGIKGQANKDIWRKDFTKQLELPGDIWNARFFKNCTRPIAEKMGIRGTKAPKVLRDLWEGIRSKCPESYPEQFDISFDFTPRMCEKNLCAICPFGRNGAKLICIPTKDKYCPVALITCGYVGKCTGKQNRCVVKEGRGKGTCQGGGIKWV